MAEGVDLTLESIACLSEKSGAIWAVACAVPRRGGSCLGGPNNNQLYGSVPKNLGGTHGLKLKVQGNLLNDLVPESGKSNVKAANNRRLAEKGEAIDSVLATPGDSNAESRHEHRAGTVGD